MLQSAATVRNDFQAFLLRMAGKFEPYPFLRKQEVELRQLSHSLSKPFTLAVFGRMKTGKSSLINALVGKPLAITGVEEATATLNWISYGTPAQADTVLVHWKDGRVEPIAFERLMDWSGKDAAVLERVSQTAYLQLFADAERLKEVQIVDTPGTGSVAAEHEQIAQQFLSPRAGEDSEEEGKRADALLYVFPPVARERDEDSLAEFRRTRLPGSDPYNSIGVLHKWDGLESDDIAAEASKKAERLRASLSDVVCDVIPVSAPLAMMARHAPDGFFEALLNHTMYSGSHDALRKSLRRDSRWDEDAGRRATRQSYPLPWVSFVRLVNLLMETSCQSAAEARATSLEASGIERLELALDRRFFRRAAIIKQRLTRVKATGPVQSGLMLLSRRIKEIQADHCHFMDLASVSITIPQHEQWLLDKTTATRKEAEELEVYAIAADREWLVEKEQMDLMEQDLIFLEKMTTTPSFVEPRDCETIHKLLKSATAPNDDDLITIEVIYAILKRYQHFVNAPQKQTRDLFEHLIRRVQENIQARLNVTV
jgi:GTPase SAR1 family protein